MSKKVEFYLNISIDRKYIKKLLFYKFNFVYIFVNIK